jgi:hypothetical protein
MPLLFCESILRCKMIFILKMNTLWFPNTYNYLTIAFKIYIISPNLI